MAYTKDIERVCRQFKRQRLDPEYIRHYLFETYQLDADTIDTIFEAVGLIQQSDGNPMVTNKGKANDDKNKKRKDRFGSFFR